MSGILCYHSVDKDWASALSVPVQVFSAQVSWMSKHLAAIDAEHAVATMDIAGRLPRGMTSLTFDDGYIGVHRHAFPVLNRLGLRATLFVVSGALDGSVRPADWIDPSDLAGHEVEVVGPEELRELGEEGWSFGSHSHSHRDLARLSERECELDLRESREKLEDVLARPIRLLAYPRGHHDEHVRRAAERAGFTHGFALPDEREQVGRFSVPRVGIYRGDGVRTLRAKLSRWYLPVRTSFAYPLVRGAVRAARAVGGRG